MAGYTDKTDRILYTKSTRVKSKAFRVIREQYLRSDIPCQSEICTRERCAVKDGAGSTSRLSNNATHYLIPDVDVAGHYLEILEFPEISSVIFLQSVVTKVLHDLGKRVYTRICRKIKDASSNSVFYPNEFCVDVYLEREIGEAFDDWLLRNLYKCALWYFHHLQQKVPIVVLTEKPKLAQQYGNMTTGIHIMTIGEYLTLFWHNLPSALMVYESLSASLTAVAVAENTGYKEHFAKDILLSGVQSGKYWQGMLKVNKHNAQHEAFLSTTAGNMNKVEDILIPGMKMRNRAIEGDLVVVEILPKDQWQCRSARLREGSEEQSNASSGALEKIMMTGQVVGVLQHGWRDYAASFSLAENSSGQQRSTNEAILVVPYDYRIPKIRILTLQAENLKNDRIVVKIDSWTTNSQYPNGHFVRSLGKCGELETEIATLLVEHEVTANNFSAKVLSEMPDESWQVNEEEAAKRKDLRETHLIFSIDPVGCEDVDDCLSYRELADGRHELGVHIADVAWFVPPNLATDLEARVRSTTVYMADRRFDMLPRILNSNLCSLLSGVDRYSVSVIWTLNPNYEVLDVWFGRTVIRSAYKLSYEVAQEILNGSLVEEMIDEIPELQHCEEKVKVERFNTLSRSLVKLTDIGNSLKLKRQQQGALELESTEVQIEFEEGSKDLQSVKPKQALEVHEVVAECMIFANHSVAKKIYDVFPEQSLLRFHPPPRENYFKDLQLCAETKGFTFEFGSNKTLAMSLNRAVDKEDPYTNLLMKMMTVQAMMVAKYFSTGSFLPEEYYHYGLALDKYTHFTSPIRRYADIVVHRLLVAAVNVDTDVPNLMPNAALQELCDHINAKHRAAQNCQKASQQLFLTKYFEDADPESEKCIVDAIIFSMRANGFLVYVPRYAMKAPVYLVNKENNVAFVVNGLVEWTSGKLAQRSCTLAVESSLGCQKYKLFDHITVQIELVSNRLHASSFKLNLVNNKPTVKELMMSETSPRMIKPVNILKEMKEVSDLPSVETNASAPGSPDISESLYLIVVQLRELVLQVPQNNFDDSDVATGSRRVPAAQHWHARHKPFASETNLFSQTPTR